METQNYKVDFFAGILLVIGLFVGASVAYAVGQGLSALLADDIRETAWYQALAYLITFVTPILFFDFFVVRKDGAKLRFDFSTKPLRVYLLIFPMMFGMMLIADYTTQLIPTTGDLLGPLYKLYTEEFAKLLKSPVATIIMTVILAPILEEILFRGIIMKGMINNGTKPLLAIALSAFIFGVVHFNPWQFAGALLLGLVLGLVYYKTKSLLMSILLHAFNNLISAMLMIYSDSETFSQLFGIRNEILLIMGIVIFIIPFYFFAIKKNIIYKD
ncbi:CPBP family intramembrane glutamic endopeptidase [Epilithonimonas vandammei]|jgi:uncharacterized protein|uniref:CPBP family intramembrane metalloprotease n=1 Tax=Epilithonimonas vandammei TaxID=2487072 RepID=A0A3G8Y4M4_9FLAO|nr:type II CAAX endopeptidase family protein [Epilithonimonas vandammei]AZI40269.1 CPBP family intramembrane metalloprotease [Epilithonimonas vandammei]